jgi:hypothetical protein
LTLAFRARDSVLERPVFVKCLNPALAKDEEIRARFEREAKAVARLDHPNLVRIYEYGEDPDEGLYMLLEWLDGTTLGARIAQGETFAGEAFTALASQLLAGLAALHSVGILHRDLKPENILVADSGQELTFKITDFSLAALRDAPKLTHHEAIVGTPAYMSPEQAAGGQPGETSDLFSLGVVLYEAATGENPFAGQTMMETLRNVRDAEPSFKHPAIVDLPERPRELLSKLLQKDPAARPASANAARSLLGERVPVKEEPVARPQVSLSRYLILVLILLALWLLRKQFPADTHTFDLLMVPLVIIGLFVSRRPRKTAIKPEYLRPRNRKRDLKYLAAAVAVIAFWGGMMLWYPWGGKVDGGRMKDEGQTPASVVPVKPDTAAKDEGGRMKDDVKDPIKTPPATPSEPEFRAAPEGKDEGGRMKDEGVKATLSSAPQIAAASTAIPDSVNLALTTEPWAQVYLNGVQLGTTPFSGTVRVPGGSQTLVLRNPAFPPVQVTLNLSSAQSRADIRLADHAALVRVNVEPWGELYLDGEHIGTTPLPRPLFVSPGHHSVRVSHPQLSTLQQDFQIAAGETVAISMDLSHGQASIQK